MQHEESMKRLNGGTHAGVSMGSRPSVANRR